MGCLAAGPARGMRAWSLCVLALTIGCPAADDRPADTPAFPLTVADAGFATPESVLHDQVADVYLVSNINGSPLEADGNGFISRLSPTGEVLDLRWVDGAEADVTLNAPKGMAIVGDLLYVSDITVVRMFNRTSGAPAGEIAIPGSTFLNDLAAAPDGSVYVTDSGLRAGADGFEPSGTDAVYRIGPDGRVEAIARGEDLGRPNGLTVVNGDVWVVSFGSGELYRIAGGAKADAVTLPAGSLDGVVRVGDAFLISSWDGQAVFRGPAGGPFSEAASEVPEPADIGFDADRNRILIPLFMANEVRIVPIQP